MFSKVFLAMTAREMEEFLPKRLAYMACHFSSYSNGLSNLPVQMPENSILLLDDSMPVQGHDPAQVIGQLNELIEKFCVNALLLDFQREKDPQTQQMAAAIIDNISCPTAVTPLYANDLDCPVFLSPTPANEALQDYLRPWQGRDLFLELSLERLQFTVTENGSVKTVLPPAHTHPLPHRDESLHCHYETSVFPDKVVFTLQRTREDLEALAEEAYGLGVQGVVGLYQELITFPNTK